MFAEALVFALHGQGTSRAKWIGKQIRTLRIEADRSDQHGETVANRTGRRLFIITKGEKIGEFAFVKLLHFANYGQRYITGFFLIPLNGA